MKSLKQAKQVNPYVLKMRKYFHMNPELSEQEYYTHKRIIDELKAMKIEYEVVGDYSIIAYLNKNSNKRTIAYRAEMDALPIQETGKYEFHSLVRNVSHMCGHDAHMAILLGVLKVLKDMPLNGCLMVIFEESNETYNGSQRVLDSGVLENVDLIFTLHNMPNLKSGEISVHEGLQLIGSDQIKIEISGKSAHSSLPSESNDVILASASFIDNIQSVISKSVNPQDLAFASITKFMAGYSNNVTASQAEFNLNLRYGDSSIRSKAHNIIKQFLNTIEQQHSVSAKFTLSASALPTINSKQVSIEINESLEKLAPEIKTCNPGLQIVSDDFSHYLTKVKGAMGWFGAGFKSGTNYTNHTPDYYINEDSFQYALACYLQVAYDQLGIKKQK